MLAQMAEAEHGEPSGPWAVEEPTFLMAAAMSLSLNDMYGIHTVVVEVLHEPSECLILLGRKSSKLPVEGLCNCLRDKMGFASKAIEMFVGGLDFLPPSLRRRAQ